MTTAKTEQLEQAVATLDALEESSIDLGQQQTQLSDNNTLIMKKARGRMSLSQAASRLRMNKPFKI